MGLRIRTNVASLKAQRRLNQTTERAGQSHERLASGFRINRAADDAAGLAITERMSADLRSLAQAKRNANDGVSLVQTAEGSVSEVSNILARLRELATQSATDTLGNRERSFINKEYNQLLDEIDRIGSSAVFNGVELFNASEKYQLHIGIGDGRVPNRDTIAVDMSKMKIDTQKVFGLLKGESVGPMDAKGEFVRQQAADKLVLIDNAIDRVSQYRATLGASQSRLQSTINNLGIAEENMSASRSRIRDVDFAIETANSTKARILQQAGVSVLGQANSEPELVMGLLR